MIQRKLREVLELRNEALLRNDAEAFAALFAPHGAIEQPFARDGVPARLEGRERIRAFSARGFAAVRIDALEEIAAHQTDDPEVVIVELLAKGVFASSGHPFSTRSISVFRIRDGAIVLFRTYTGPVSETAANPVLGSP